MLIAFVSQKLRFVAAFRGNLKIRMPKSPVIFQPDMRACAIKKKKERDSEEKKETETKGGKGLVQVQCACRCVDHDLGGIISRPSNGRHGGNATREDATAGAKISQGRHRTSRPCLA